MSERVIIAALAANRVIGRDNAIPWRLPADLKRFKALTTGHTIIMGRKTWESLGRPLPQRRHIVVTRNPAYAAAGAEIAPNLDAALRACADEATVFIIGGAQIYEQALAVADRMELTEIHAEFPGDACFPKFDAREWIEALREPQRAENEIEYDFVRYQRRLT